MIDITRKDGKLIIELDENKVVQNFNDCSEEYEIKDTDSFFEYAKNNLENGGRIDTNNDDGGSKIENHNQKKRQRASPHDGLLQETAFS